MSKKRGVLLALVIFAAFLAGTWHGRKSTVSADHAISSGRGILGYACPMHPGHTSERPGTAPCCGMRLEPVYAAGTPGPQAAGGGPVLLPGVVTVSPDRQQLVGIRIEEVDRRSGKHEMRLAGKVAADENRTFTVNAAVDGWVREVFPVSTGSVVSQDQPLATFYSKELLPAQQNYFYALGNLDRVQKSEFSAPEQVSLTNVQVWSNEDTLESLGMGQTQIKELARTRRYTRNIVIRAPAAGFVLARNVSAGQRFQRGQELYRIADLRRVWILADVFGREAGYVRPGQGARISLAGSDSVFRAMVSEVLPQFDPDTRTLRVRLELDNPGYALRPDMFVDVLLPVELPPAVTVPTDAVIDSGLRKTVYLHRGNGYFEPRVVETGWRLGDRVQVIAGLEPGEHVVVSGNFLIDSESRMRLTQASAMSVAEKTAAEKDPVCGMDVDPKNPKAIKTVYGGKTYYFCSDHCKRSFEADPGKYVPKQKKDTKQSAHDAQGARAPA